MEDSDEFHDTDMCTESTPLIPSKGLLIWPALPTWKWSPSSPALPTWVRSPSSQGPACSLILENLKSAVNNVTVEPIVFLSVFAWTLQTTLVTNMVLEKVCEAQYNHSAVECRNLTAEMAMEVATEASTEGMQRDTAWLMMLQEVLASMPAVLYVLLLGSWSDVHGRKLPMLLPFIGSFLATVVYMINAYWWWIPVEGILVAGVARGLTGGLITLLMATYSYIADISGHSSRTLRIAFLDFAMFIGAPVGLFLSSVVYTHLGYLGVFSVSGCAFLLATFYILFCIENTRGPASACFFQHPPSGRSTNSNKFWEIFDLRNVRRSLGVAIRRRENFGRAKILSLMLALCLLLFTSGSAQLEYLYTKRKFGWGYWQYVELNIFDIVFGSVGTSLVLPVLSYRYRVKDTVLAVLGCLSKTVGLIATGLGATAALMYVGSVLSFLAGLPLIVTRAVISKLVPAGEAGAVFSLLAALEALVPLFSCPAYTFTYAATLQYYPGTMYFLSVVATTSAGFIYAIITLCES